MSITAYLSAQLPERQQLLQQLHELILQQDKTVTASVEPMMGKEMIQYKAAGTFKYALSSVKNHMSLHLMPIYGSAALHAKYKALLKDAEFQKGCINFKNEAAMPIKIVKSLLADCAKIDLKAMREAYMQSKKK